MPFLELSLHITDQHLDPGSSWLEIPVRRGEFLELNTHDCTNGNISTLLGFLTLPKEPWPRTLSSSNCDGSAFSQPSFTWCVIGISLYVPSSYTHSAGVRQPHQTAGMPSYMHTHAHNPKPHKPVITYTVWERLSLFHGLIHDLMPIDLQSDQQVSSGDGNSEHFHKPCLWRFSAERVDGSGSNTPTCMMADSADEINESHATPQSLLNVPLYLLPNTMESILSLSSCPAFIPP